MDLNKVISNNQSWVENKLKVDPGYFNDLAKGQSPEILYIGCSDSRVPAEQLMGLGPGEVFVHRNIANMVVNTDMNAQSVIDYAVVHLKVKHIVICGHYYCGGVKAAMLSDNMALLNPWLRQIRDVYRLHQDELEKIGDEDQRYRRLIELNVQEQCTNAIKIPTVQSRFLDGELNVHGWVFDIGTGKIVDLKLDMKKIIEDFLDIYRVE